MQPLCQQGDDSSVCGSMCHCVGLYYNVPVRCSWFFVPNFLNMPHLKNCHWVVAYNFSIHMAEQHSLLLCWKIDFIMGILLMDNKTKFDFVRSGLVEYMNIFHNLHLFHWEIINCFSEKSADWVITTIIDEWYHSLHFGIFVVYCILFFVCLFVFK